MEGFLFKSSKCTGCLTPFPPGYSIGSTVVRSTLFLRIETNTQGKIQDILQDKPPQRLHFSIEQNLAPFRWPSILKYTRGNGWGLLCEVIRQWHSIGVRPGKPKPRKYYPPSCCLLLHASALALGVGLHEASIGLSNR